MAQTVVGQVPTINIDSDYYIPSNTYTNIIYNGDVGNVYLPSLNNVILGQIFKIINIGSGILTINASNDIQLDNVTVSTSKLLDVNTSATLIASDKWYLIAITASSTSGGSSFNIDPIAIGIDAGATSQNPYAIAIGYSAGSNNQQSNAIAIGSNAGLNSQAQSAIAIGTNAGLLQGEYAIAIGKNAGNSNQPANSIIINATGTALNATGSGLFVAPIRSGDGSNVLYYDNISAEITYGADITTTLIEDNIKINDDMSMTLNSLQEVVTTSVSDKSMAYASGYTKNTLNYTFGNANEPLFIAVGDKMHYSAGDVWYKISDNAYNSITWNGNMWVATTPTTLSYSYDGKNWTESFTNTLNFKFVYYGDKWIAGGSGVVYSYDGINWIDMSMTPINNIAWNGNMYIAIEPNMTIIPGKIYYSNNGINWTDTGATINNGSSIIWNGNMWLIGGDNIKYSVDGINWTDVTSPINNVKTIAWNGNMFVIGGGGIAYSYNGINWTVASNISCNTIVWNGKWLAGGPGNLQYSYNGKNWIESVNIGNVDNIAYNAAQYPGKITFPQNKILAGGGPGIKYSYDGKTWSSVGVTGFDPSEWIYKLAYNNIWLASTYNSRLYYSYDGLQWFNTFLISSVISYITSFAYGDGKWIAASNTVFNFPNNMLFSYDGINWIFKGSPLRSINIHYNKLWILAGIDNINDTKFAYSYDGNNWTISNLIVDWVWTIASNDNIYLAACSGEVVYSYDGKVWYTISSLSGDTYYYAVAWNGNMWLLGGDVNDLYYSYDGINWTIIEGVVTATVSDIKWIGDKWVLTIDNNTNNIRYSYNGFTWFNADSFADTAYSICWNNPSQGFVKIQQPSIAVGNDISYSKDGINWQIVKKNFNGKAVAWNGNMWVAVANNKIAYSTDGLEWTINNVNTDCNAICWTGNVWVVVGGGTNKLIYSFDGLEWLTPIGEYFPGAGSAVFYNGQYVMAVGNSTTYYASTDGINWTAGTLTGLTSARCITARGTRWFIGGDGTNKLIYSNNLTTWTAVTNTLDNYIAAIFCNGPQMIAIGSGTPSIKYSTDGLTWSNAIDSLNTIGLAVTWNSQLWIAGYNNALQYSHDGIKWYTSQSYPTFGVASNPKVGFPSIESKLSVKELAIATPSAYNTIVSPTFSL
jgi:hypothetical protein